MRIHGITQTLILKVVYYGPGMSGKTTNLQQLHALVPEQVRGKLVQLDTDTERTLFFDYFPLTLGRLGRYSLRVHFFTVPGQSFYNATRRTVLQGADGIVFVADSAASREQANLVAYRNMLSNLRDLGQDPAETPLVFQWNKRDAKDALPVPLMEKLLNPTGCPSVSAVARNGEGVQLTQAHIVQEVMRRLRGGKIGTNLEAVSRV